METNIGNQKAKVIDVRANQVTFKVKNPKFKSQDSIKIYIPKKTIAVMDFSLLGMTNSSIKQMAMEDMTTKLVQSGQYIVVERAKLDTILKEQKLATSGLLEESAASKIGKLVSADIILTGSFAKRGDKWNVNLRLIDVATGIIISAINEQISIEQFHPKQSKDNTNITEDFEDETLSKGWLKTLVNKNGAKSKSSIDKTVGANGTLHSYKIDYFLTRDNSITAFINKRSRNLSKYTGVRFYAKSSSTTTLAFVLFDKNYNDGNSNKWFNPVSVDKEWKEYKIPFSELMLDRYFARQNPGGDGVLDLDAVDGISFGLKGKVNIKNEWNSIWIDEINLY